MTAGDVLLEVRNLVKHFPVRKGVFGRVTGQVHAVDDVSFSIASGETLGLVGESGCGKSTTGKAVLKLVEPTSGSIDWRGRRIDELSASNMRPYRRELQAVFQDPYSSLNPRMRAEDIVGEPIRNFETAGRAERADRCLVGHDGVHRDGDAGNAIRPGQELGRLGGNHAAIRPYICAHVAAHGAA